MHSLSRSAHESHSFTFAASLTSTLKKLTIQSQSDTPLFLKSTSPWLTTQRVRIRGWVPAAGRGPAGPREGAAGRGVISPAATPLLLARHADSDAEAEIERWRQRE